MKNGTEKSSSDFDKTIGHHLEAIATALRILEPTGENGFEGLLAIALENITKVSFRLAKSGTQDGIDGAFHEAGVGFEAKRYSAKIPKNEVLSKIVEFDATNKEPDLVWVLGATVPVSTQLDRALRNLGDKLGITVLVYDWYQHPLPKLAILLACGSEAVEDFLRSHLSSEENLEPILTGLNVVRNHDDFHREVKSIEAELREPSMMAALARSNNSIWLTETFSSRRKSKTRLGQSLSPARESPAKTLLRAPLVSEIQPFLLNAPKDQIAFILGGEGYGKSWTIAQSWLALQEQPLMVIMCAESFTRGVITELHSLLISTLIYQSGDQASDKTRNDWEHRFSRWKKSNVIASPKLVVVIDGINQKPEIEWHRIIEGMASILREIGGQLIVTSRTPYFTNAVKHRLLTLSIEVSVPQWLDEERDEILLNQGIKPSLLNKSVLESLLNPRLLGIALEVFTNEKVSAFQEFSVSRLLFEHIRDGSGAPSPSQFASTLQSHAKEILERIKEEQTDDLRVFQADIPAVADGRFFFDIPGEQSSYELRDSGLSVALGFAIQAKLRHAIRNEHNLDEALSRTLEPVSALDDTFEALLAALIISCLDEENTDSSLVSILVRGFAGLQNPDQSRLLEFIGLAKFSPLGFLAALENIALQGGRQPNFDWILKAVLKCSKDSRIWPDYSQEIKRWLSFCSLTVKIERVQNLNPPAKDPGEVESRRTTRQNKIQESIANFTLGELSIFERLIPIENGDLSRLSGLAIEMLIGSPLENFAESLVSWFFGYSLNSELDAPYDELLNLIRFNTSDWEATQLALKTTLQSLEGAKPSSVGEWTLISALRATGDPNDADTAESLVKQLSQNVPWSTAWRLIETYCASDPCDPSSKRPSNIGKTAIEYKSLDTSKLHADRWAGEHDHFFRGARPGLARFELPTVINKHLELVEQVTERNGYPLERGLLELASVAPLLTRLQIDKLKTKWIELSNSRSEVSENEHFSGHSQQILAALSPHLTPIEKAELFLIIDDSKLVLLDVLDALEPISADDFDSLIAEKTKTDEEDYQALLLMLAEKMPSPLSNPTAEWLRRMSTSKASRIRALAFNAIASSQDFPLLQSVVDGDWDANRCAQNETFEKWSGSTLLLEACLANKTNLSEVVPRMAPSFFKAAADVLPTEDVREITILLDVAIRKIVNPSLQITKPPIEVEVLQDSKRRCTSFSIDESEPTDLNDIEKWKRISDPDEFCASRKRCSEAFKNFKKQLKDADAQIVLEDWSFEAFEKLLHNQEGIAQEWFQLLISAPESRVPAIYNLTILLAAFLSSTHPEQTLQLRQKVLEHQPYVRITIAQTPLGLETLAFWQGADSPYNNETRFSCLDRAVNDHEISNQVLAALYLGKQSLLNEYIADRITRPEPSYKARALMVAGFSDENEYAAQVISSFSNTNGFIGEAHKAALYAYQRNSWSRIWYSQMCTTDETSLFWQAKVLLQKIVDGRFAVWNGDFNRTGSAIRNFEMLAERGFRNRYRTWETARKKNLFGQKAPDRALIRSSVFG